MLICRDTLWVKNFIKITLSKIRNGPILGETKNWSKNVLVNPVDQKFCRNRSITHGFRDTGIFEFSLFGKFVMINN